MVYFSHMPQPITKETFLGDVIHEWIVREYDSHDRGKLWYLLVGILGIALVIYGVVSGNFMFSLIIILTSIILFMQHHQDAQEVLFQVTELGVVVGTKFYQFNELDSFYIIYQPPQVKTLFIETKSVTRPLIRVPLMDNNPLEVRTIMQEFLEEDIEKEDEPMSDTFARQWKLH